MSSFYNDGKECCSIMLLVAQKQSLLADVTAEASDEVSADRKTILTSWSTAKQLLKSDPRYSKMLRKERENLWRQYEI
ncbi:hypothetical protein MKX01_022844 [Papaver californicum]|nr:hypothetical protein MKX01_022844 [Papaver californicum]